jgi:hypothetical protein
VTGASAPGPEEAARPSRRSASASGPSWSASGRPLPGCREGPLPETDHDFRLDLIVAREEVIRCRRTRRPQGILWEHLDAAKVAGIPALAARVRQHGTL